MLKTEAVPVNLLNVLTDLQDKTSRAGFSLAGGTSLALRFGHRLSVDLDFFTGAGFDPASLAAQFGIGPEAIIGQAEGTLQLRIEDVKIEFLRHAYPKLADDDCIQGIHLWSMADVAAMKLNAIANRGSKKDFYDIATLLEVFPLESMLQFYREKYHPGSILMLIRSLAWFDDAEAEPDPRSLRNDSWEIIKGKIATAIRSLK